MPHFFFDIVHKGQSTASDTEGVTLAGLPEAQAEAQESAKELAAEAVRSGKVIDGDYIEVTNEPGDVVVKQPLRDVIFLNDREKTKNT